MYNVLNSCNLQIHRVRKKRRDSILAITLTNLDIVSRFLIMNHADTSIDSPVMGVWGRAPSGIQGQRPCWGTDSWTEF